MADTLAWSLVLNNAGAKFVTGFGSLRFVHPPKLLPTTIHDRALRNKKITRYLENHPVGRDEIVRAAQEGTRPTPLPTPAPTPHNSDTPDSEAPTCPLPQYVIQEELESGTSPRITQRGRDDSAGAHQSFSGASHGQSSTARQGRKDETQLSNETNINGSRFD
ncbi:uncharacterized protein PAC_19555 [Phialocephala subalpina]|uniref:Uncharacterized protein n=1 Tax=Phialocephala subalpina TaxID=576137 RepID=A0A1L7XXK9_9HELO|nr:uncharacterized protein PAC_19555 [Phialocephala subalpina]